MKEMTGKEALVKLQVGCMTVWDAEECYNAINEDLEVLEILKACPKKKKKLFDNYEMPKEIEDRYFFETITDEQVDKIKAWLERKN